MELQLKMLLVCKNSPIIFIFTFSKPKGAKKVIPYEVKFVKLICFEYGKVDPDTQVALAPSALAVFFLHIDLFI